MTLPRFCLPSLSSFFPYFTIILSLIPHSAVINCKYPLKYVRCCGILRVPYITIRWLYTVVTIVIFCILCSDYLWCFCINDKVTNLWCYYKGEEFVSESLEYITFGDEILGVSPIKFWLNLVICKWLPNTSAKSV